MHNVRIDDSADGRLSIQDSQSPYGHQGLGSSQHSQHYMTDDEFQRIMDEPPRNFRLGLEGSLGPVGHGRQLFSCPPFSSRAQPPTTPAGGVELSQDNADGVVGPPSKKRALKKPAKRPAKQAKKVSDLNDDDGEGGDGAGASRWTKPEVSQLIAFHSEMDDEFDRNASKQGVSTWDKLQAKMAMACPNFTKSFEACRKKWKVIYRQYSNDKRILQVSGEGRKVTCKFFYEIDMGFNNRANVRKLTHGDARGSANPCPIDLNTEDEGHASGGSDGPSMNAPSSVPTEISPQTSKASKKSQGEIYTSAVTEMVTHTSQIASQITDQTQVMKDLRLDMLKLIEKL